MVWLALEIWAVFSHRKSHSVLVWLLSWYLVLGSQSSRACRDQTCKVLEVLSIYHPDPYHLWVELSIYVVSLEKREVSLIHSVDRTLDRDFSSLKFHARLSWISLLDLWSHTKDTWANKSCAEPQCFSSLKYMVCKQLDIWLWCTELSDWIGPFQSCVPRIACEHRSRIYFLLYLCGVYLVSRVFHGRHSLHVCIISGMSL